MYEFNHHKITANEASCEGVGSLPDGFWGADKQEWRDRLYFHPALRGGGCLPSCLTVMLIYRKRCLCPLLSELMVFNFTVITLVPRMVPWFIPFVLESHICSLSRKVTGREIFLLASKADQFFNFFILFFHLSLGPAGAPWERRRLEQTVKTNLFLSRKHNAEYINTRSRLIS